MKKNMMAALGTVALFASLFFSTETMAQSWNNNSHNNNSHNNNSYNNNSYSGSHNNGYSNNQHYSLQELHSRIVEGLQSKQLTRQEAQVLLQKENSIKRQEWSAKRDGFITYQEQASLNRQLDQLAKDIYKEKHDFQTASNSNPYWRR
jgi:hypothetical protein